MSLILLGILNSQAAAAGGAGAYDLLETVEPSGVQYTEFTGLDSYTDYKHLQLRALVKTTTSGTNLDSFTMQFNGDSGSNYSYHALDGNGSSVSSNGFTSQTSIRFLDTLAKGGDSGVFGADVIDILDFANTSKNKTVRALHGVPASSEQQITLTSGAWYNTAAITSIKFNVSNTAAGSRFSLYGVR